MFPLNKSNERHASFQFNLPLSLKARRLALAVGAAILGSMVSQFHFSTSPLLLLTALIAGLSSNWSG
jgi:hypothetical protein